MKDKLNSSRVIAAIQSISHLFPNGTTQCMLEVFKLDQGKITGANIYAIEGYGTKIVEHKNMRTRHDIFVVISDIGAESIPNNPFFEGGK